MDAQWNFREAYNEARKLRDAQDSFCSKVEADSWKVLNNENVHDLPENLLWESLVEVLRGRVKVKRPLLAEGPLLRSQFGLHSFPSIATKLLT